MSIGRMCRWMGVSSSDFYAWKTREPCQRKKNDMIPLADVSAQFVTSNETYGARPKHAEL